MIRNLTTASSVALALCAGTVCLVMADDDATETIGRSKTKVETRKDDKVNPPNKGGNATEAEGTNKADIAKKTDAADKSHDPKEDPDRAELRRTCESYALAFSEGNVKAIMDHFADKAEYVDPHGNVFHGKQEIQNLLTAFFEGHPKTRLEINMGDTRLIGDGIAIEDGSSSMRFGDDTEALACEYTAVHQKIGGNWLTISVREKIANSAPTHSAQLQQMNWLLGEWVHEGDDEVVYFSCESSDNGNFLIRKFAVQVGGIDVINGTQRIGWDPRTGKLRTWVFDSEGGYGDGDWERSGNDWVLRLTGVTKDGRSASSTSIYTPIDANTMVFQSVDHEIEGDPVPDSDPLTIVRQSPKPE